MANRLFVKAAAKAGRFRIEVQPNHFPEKENHLKAETQMLSKANHLGHAQINLLRAEVTKIFRKEDPEKNLIKAVILMAGRMKKISAEKPNNTFVLMRRLPANQPCVRAITNLPTVQNQPKAAAAVVVVAKTD